MKQRLKTERLLLRPFMLSDAKDVQRLAGNKAIAETTLEIPHPYEDRHVQRGRGSTASRYFS